MAISYQANLTIVNRNVSPVGMLLDGSNVQFDLFDQQQAGRDFFAADAVVEIARDSPQQITETVPDSLTRFRGFSVAGVLKDILASATFSFRKSQREHVPTFS